MYNKSNQQPATSNQRDPFIDNVKGILIFFVVLGHVIEKYINSSYLFIPYVYIYIFHMPLFIYVSGYLSKNIEKTQRSAFVRFLLPYMVWNTVYYVLQTMYERKIVYSFLNGGWTLWYLQALFIMSLCLPIVLKLRYNIIMLFCFSLIIGFFSEFGGSLSLSRTVCFFGFFLLGYYSDSNIFEKIKQNKIIIIFITIIAGIIIYLFCISEFGLAHIRGITGTLWRNTAYKNLGIGQIYGLVLRIISIPLSVLFSAFVLVCIPKSKNILAIFGKQSIIIYIFHGYFVRILNKCITINGNDIIGIIVLILFSIGIVLFLSIPVFQNIYNKGMKLIERIIIKEIM